jgi:hypothetical protein
MKTITLLLYKLFKVIIKLFKLEDKPIKLIRIYLLLLITNNKSLASIDNTDYIPTTFKTIDGYCKSLLIINSNIEAKKSISRLSDSNRRYMPAHMYFDDENGFIIDSSEYLGIFKTQCKRFSRNIISLSKSSDSIDRLNLQKLQYYINELVEHLDALVVLNTN